MEPESRSPETEPLLLPVVDDVATTKPKFKPKFSAATLIIPVAVACRLAILLPSTTTFYVIQQFVCRRWYAVHGPDSIPPSGRVPDELCTVPGVEQSYAATLSFTAAVSAMGGILGYSLASYLASRFGRKSAMLSTIGLGIVANFSIMALSSFPGPLDAFFLVLWLISESLSTITILAFHTNLYIVDVTDAEQRTSALSALWGWTMLGGSIAFSIGGFVTDRSQDTALVYIGAGVILAASFLYIAFILPESFPEEKREERRRQRIAQQAIALDSTDVHVHKLRRWWDSFMITFEPIKQLKPTRNTVSGKRNWRLLICSFYIFMTNVGAAYSTVALLVYLRTQYNYNTTETGYVLTIQGLTSVFVLTAIIPVLVRLLSPYYKRRLFVHSHERAANEEVVSEASDHLNVHVTFISWLIESAGYLLLGATTTRAGQYAAVVFHGFGAGRNPVFRSLVVATVDPLKQGEALAAIEMVGSVGEILSPIAMGGILTATISTFPQLVFYVHTAIVVCGASVLFFIRDSDRFQN